MGPDVQTFKRRPYKLGPGIPLCKRIGMGLEILAALAGGIRLSPRSKALEVHSRSSERIMAVPIGFRLLG